MISLTGNSTTWKEAMIQDYLGFEKANAMDSSTMKSAVLAGVNLSLSLDMSPICKSF